MKVTGVTILIHNRPAPIPGSAGHRGTVPLGVLSIETDEGVTGNAFVSAPGADVHHVSRQIVETVGPRLVGRDPGAITEYWTALTRMGRLLDATVVGIVDVALWDLAGKAAGMPIHRMLGTFREQIPAYLSSWVHRQPGDYVDEALHYQSLGWTGYKLHPLTQRRSMMHEAVPIATDIDTCSRVRDAVGPQMDLMLDSAWAYDHKEALDVGLHIQDLDYLWYEDPLLHADDIYGYAKLREKLHIPILATEIIPGGVFAYPSWLEARATDALRGDPVIKGGISGMLKIAHLAEAYHLNCEVHDSYSSLMNVAALHVALGISNTTSYEVLSIHPPGEYGLMHVNYGLVDPIEVDARGFVHAPTKPGLGHDIDWELLRSNVDVVIG